MSIIDAFLESKQPETRKVRFYADLDLAERFGEVEAKRDTAKRASERRPDDAEAAAVADDAEHDYAKLAEELRSVETVYVFTAIEAVAFDKLKGEHRPTEHERTEARKAGGANPDWSKTFQPALVAAACIEVSNAAGSQAGMSEEEAKRLWASEKVNEAERAELFNAALSAYLTRTRIDLPKVG